MTVIDLSHFISESMPIFPGTEPPRIADAFTIAKHGFAEKSFQLFSHVGTHIDAPGHILPGAATLDELAVDRFLGAGLVLDVAAVSGDKIEIADLEPYKESLNGVEFALLHSGWARHWGEDRYFSSYPVLSRDAAQWLTGFRLKGFGVDMISVDEVESTSVPVHKVFFANNMIIIENLDNLGTLLGKEFIFSCLPLKIPAGDGSPVRAVAIIKE
ncbi:MAG: cyclase family protein [Chrysiogenales bacterium]|nr:cyclase family protein [Candidatus Aminicenantes bacterium]TFG80071.1 MAG: cyclase family protein [Chrysiogenales bacterium]